MNQHPRVHQRWSYWKGWPLLGKGIGALMLLLIYFPLLWLALMSISERPLSGIPLPLSLAHYTALWQDTRWIGPFGASLAMALLIGVLCAVCATYVGRALPLTRRPGRLMLLLVLPLFIPGMSMGAALFILTRTVLGLKLGFWSIAVGHFIWAFPFALLIIMVLTTRFDHRLIEAGADLGASKWQIFRDIELPLLRPGIVGAALFGFLLSFNEMLRTLFLRGTTETMPVWNWIMASSQQSQVPIIFALTTLVLLVTLPLFLGLFWILFVRLERQ
ncbi:ABC transporter permease [Halotalea alkalilenta]|uniref:ABC transporter permease n=1 Tax=Halotalea alkalilenta TaxID=376489 RepID=UPI000480A49F|nr:ABC transporter permease subunit [Halotalea alkalilenta]